jgi:hypothetical protein
MLTESCLFPAPPDYREPSKTRPSLWGPIPAATEIQSVSSGELFNISVNVSSEDDGEGLGALFFLNYLVGTQRNTGFNWTTVEPGTQLQERHISMTWQIPEWPSPGTCEQLTLVVSHLSNFVNGLPVNDADVDVVTWWLNINDSQSTISECAKRSGGVSP